MSNPHSCLCALSSVEYVVPVGFLVAVKRRGGGRAKLSYPDSKFEIDGNALGAGGISSGKLPQKIRPAQFCH